MKIGWVWIDSASFRYTICAAFSTFLLTSYSSLYVYSASVLLQALGVISVGGIADNREPVRPLTESKTKHITQHAIVKSSY